MPRSSLTPARLLVAAALGLVVALLSVQLAAGQSTQDRINTRQTKAQALRQAVAAETARLGRTEASLASAQARLDRIDADVDRKQARVRAVGAEIAKKRQRLQDLENRMQDAADALKKNLVEAYEHPQPDLVSVILGSHSFSALIETRNFVKRIQAENARILDTSRETRIEVDKEATALVGLQKQVTKLAVGVEKQQAKAQVARTALLDVRAQQLSRRDGSAAQLADVRQQISGLRTRQHQEQARAARIAKEAVVSGIGVNTGGLAQPPPGAPAAVAKVMAAGNAIAGLPYLYGGGHASFQASAYDCSGSVSYALAAAGLVSSPMASGPFMSWGEPGPGRWITVYANAGHAYMVVAGWRFDTSALSSGGTRWSRQLRDNVGFVARHPPGL